MTKAQFDAFYAAFVQQMNADITSKNADYAGGNADPFFNFRAIERLGLCSAEVGVMTRLMDKMGRAASLLTGNKPQVVTEKLQDTLRDAANYCVVLAALIEVKNGHQKDAG